MDYNKKFILYGIGNFCFRLITLWKSINPSLIDRILCFTDSCPDNWGRVFFGKSIIAPDDINQYEYEKIIITSERYGDEIYRLLVEQYQVSAEKIVSLHSGTAFHPPLDISPGAANHVDYVAPAENYSLYLEDVHAVNALCRRKSLMEEPAQICVINNGIILPIKSLSRNQWNHWQGGVCDASGNFIEGHRKISGLEGIVAADILGTYPITTEIITVRETVVYGGLLFNGFGHMITESLSRLWWHLVNPDSNYKFAFICIGKKPVFLEFLRMLNIPADRIIIVNEPMRFDRVIIPEQTVYFPVENCGSGNYKKNVIDVYDAIRDSVTPGCYEKIYLKKSRENDGLVNEEYFINQYRSMGYQVISPEKLTIKEQVSVMAGARQIVCVSGTLPHLTLFCQESVELVILNRSLVYMPGQYWINQARKVKCTMIDVSFNFLLASHIGPAFLLVPTVHWRRYVNERGIRLIETDKVSPQDFAMEIIEYMKQWGERMKYIPAVVPQYKQGNQLVNIVNQVNEELLGAELNEAMKQSLRVCLGTSF